MWPEKRLQEAQGTTMEQISAGQRHLRLGRLGLLGLAGSPRRAPRGALLLLVQQPVPAREHHLALLLAVAPGRAVRRRGARPRRPRCRPVCACVPT